MTKRQYWTDLAIWAVVLAVIQFCLHAALGKFTPIASNERIWFVNQANQPFETVCGRPGTKGAVDVVAHWDGTMLVYCSLMPKKS